MRPVLTRSNAILLVAVVAVASVVATGLLNALRPDGAGSSESAISSFSRSAIGHHAFHALLTELGYQTRQNQREYDAPGQTGAIIVAEPDPGRLGGKTVEAIKLTTATLLILPKWQSTGSEFGTDYVTGVERLPADAVEAVLNRFIDEQGKVVRTRGVESAWQDNHIGIPPSIHSAQLMEPMPGITPIIRSTQGVLLGAVKTYSRRLWILSDPDLINNHGIAKGQNAAVAVRILERLRIPKGSPVVFEETVHGYRLEPNLWRALWTLPLLIPTLLSCLALGLLGWGALNSFGTPFSPPKDDTYGSQRLIDTSVRLIASGHHAAEVVSRYFTHVVHEVSQRFHIPAALSMHQRLDRLAEIGATRHVDEEIEALRAECDQFAGARRKSEREATRLSIKLAKWRQEMLGDT